MSNKPIPSRKGKKTKSRAWLYVLCVLLFFVAAGLGALFASSGLLDKKEEPPEEGLLSARDKATIMIMGVDEREDDVGRSDTLMVAAIDPKMKQASIVSVPRDTRVKIKGHGWDKINAAYAYGGEKLSQRTVEDLLGLDIDHYVIINKKSFVKIIDALGGIDIDVEKRMLYEDPWDDDGGLYIDLKPGPQHMDGKTAVTYVRYRDEEGDIGRIKRQQKFMEACMDKLVSPSVIPSLPFIIGEVINSVSTDLSVKQMLEFAGALRDAQKNGLKTDMVPGRPLYIGGVSYWIPDISGLRTTIADTLGVDFTAEMRRSMERTAIEYENSIPATATEIPAGGETIGKAITADKAKDKDAKNKKKAKKEQPAKNGAAERRGSNQSGARAPSRQAPAAADAPYVPSQSGDVGKSR